MMIFLKQSSPKYNNDLRAMIMAFYPGIKIVENADSQSFLFEFHIEYHDDYTILYIIDGEYESQNLFLDYELCDFDTFEEAGHRVYKIYGCFENKELFRNKLKIASYKAMSSFAGKKLPWGDLTGVRPTKIAMKQLKEGKSQEEAIDNYVKIYDTSLRKATLATEVASNELRLVQAFDLDNDYCLYFGIPFCPSRCLYCSFTSYPIAVYKDKAVSYVAKLKEELSYIADVYKNKNLVAIYMGGGTPTSIDHELLDELLGHLNKEFDVDNLLKQGTLREYTVEAGRPDSITREKLQVLKKRNVTRISINPQTMNDATLKTIGRAHTKEDAIKAFLLAREEGFDNINMDLIAGLPGETVDSMAYTLSEIEKLNPESLTVHSLAIKRAANLRMQMEEYADSIHKDTDEMLNMVSDMATKLGMAPYYLYRQKNIGGNLENVGYSRPGTECLYNILIMEELTDIIAAGAGASTKLCFHSENRVERVENCKSVDDYIDRFDEMLERKKTGMRDKL